MRFGIFDHLEKRAGTPLHQLYAERLDYIERVEQAGFWGYFKSEHHLTPLDAAPCPSVLLAAAAQRTSTLRLVPLVYLLPFHHPLRLAEEIAMLDHLSGGRLEVGVGRGIAPPEHDMWGLEPERARERSEETLAILLRCFTEERLTFSGTFWSFTDVPIELHPLQQPHPPLWYPGNLDVAAPRGFSTIVGGPVPAVAKQVARYHERYAAADAARTGVNAANGAPPMIGGALRVYVGPNDTEAYERARASWATYTHNITLLWRRYGIAPSEMPLDPSAGGDFDRAVAVGAALAGSPQRVADHIARYAAETGVDLVLVSFAWGDLEQPEILASLERFGEHVMAGGLVGT